MPISIDHDLYEGKPVPVRYDLVFLLEDQKPTFVFSASEKLIGEIPAAPLIKIIQDEFSGIGEFDNSHETLGFGGIFKAGEAWLPLEGFTTWKARVPREVIGSVKRGKKTNWNPAMQLACSIAILMRKLEFTKAEPNPKGLKQLATLLMVCRAGMGGFGLAATLSPDTRLWIATHRSQSEETGRQAMIANFDWMWPDYLSEDRQFRLHGFKVWDNGNGNGFVMDVPGQATGIYVDGMDIRNVPGWNLESHNVDSPVQQLSLLAGLCAILRMVRESQLT